MAINDPVPSTAFDVLQRNVQDVDRYLNTSTVFNNRVGLPIKPIPMQAAEWQTAIGSVGWFPVGGDFSTGATLTARNQVIYDPASTAWYSWGGTLPKTVPAASSPASTGGISAGAWTMRSDAALATALNNGTALINGLPASVLQGAAPVMSLKSLPSVGVETTYTLIGFYAGTFNGGGRVYFDPGMAKSNHNGVTIIAPEAIAGWDGTQGGLASLFNWSGSGVGCFVRLLDTAGGRDVISPDMAGAVKSTTTPSTLSIQKVFDLFHTDVHIIGSGDYAIDNTVTLGYKVGVVCDFSRATINVIGNNDAVFLESLNRCEVVFQEIESLEAAPSAGRPLVIGNAVGCTLSLKKAVFFQKGVLISPKGIGAQLQPRQFDGHYYNNVYLNNIGRFNTTDVAVEITTISDTTNPNYADGKSGRAYVNENDFHFKALRAADCGVRTTRGAGQWDPFNGNIFYQTGFEKCPIDGLDLNFAESNTVFYPRFENIRANFSGKAVKEGADCAVNVFYLHRVEREKCQFFGLESQIYATFTDSVGTFIADRAFSNGSTRPLVYASTGRINQDLSQVQPLQEVINGNTAATDNNKPLDKWRGFVKDSQGVVKPFGLLGPLSERLINAFTPGQVIEVGEASFIRLRGGANGDAVTLKMSEKRQIAGFTCVLEIDTPPLCLITIQNAAGAVNISPSAFVNNSDTRGTFMLVYRDFAWRSARISDRLRSA